MERYFVFLRPLASDFPDKGMKWEAQSAEEMGKEYYPLMGLGKSRPSGLRKTKYLSNSLAHRTTWLRSDFKSHVNTLMTGGLPKELAEDLREVEAKRS